MKMDQHGNAARGSNTLSHLYMCHHVPLGSSAAPRPNRSGSQVDRRARKRFLAPTSCAFKGFWPALRWKQRRPSTESTELRIEGIESGCRVSVLPFSFCLEAEDATGVFPELMSFSFKSGKRTSSTALP